MATSRITSLDLMKAVGIIMVVIGHTNCPDELKRMFYFVHMPLFFFLSGVTNRQSAYFHTVSNCKDFFLKRVKSLYIPFLTYSVPIVLLHNILYYIGCYDNEYSLTGFITQLVRTLLFSIGKDEPLLPQLWFIKCLFIVEILFAVVAYCTRKSKTAMCLALILLILAGYSLSASKVIEHNILLPCRALLYFIVGMLYGGGTLLKYRTNAKYLTVLIPIYVLVWFYVSEVCVYTAITDVSLVWLPLQLTCTLVLVFILNSLDPTICSFSSSRYIYQLGQKTMPIYFLQYAAFLLITNVFTLMMSGSTSSEICIDNIPWYTYTVIATVLCLIPTIIRNKIK